VGASSIPELRDLERIAENLVLRFGGPPADIEAVAHASGIHLITLGDIDVAALLVVGAVANSWAVVLRQSDSYVRRRFSLAHETAHVALGLIGDERRYLGRVAARSSPDPTERKCDFFAACLLMPREWVNAAVKVLPPRRLPRLFEASELSVKIRLRELGHHAAAEQLK
jgi:hypothetical protein